MPTRSATHSISITRSYHGAAGNSAADLSSTAPPTQPHAQRWSDPPRAWTRSAAPNRPHPTKRSANRTCRQINRLVFGRPDDPSTVSTGQSCPFRRLSQLTSSPCVYNSQPIGSFYIQPVFIYSTRGSQVQPGHSRNLVRAQKCMSASHRRRTTAALLLYAISRHMVRGFWCLLPLW